MFRQLQDSLNRRKLVRLMALADAARDGGDPARAAELYNGVVKTFPDAAGAWVQLGNMSKDIGLYDRALRAYSTALDLAPDDADVCLQLGHLAKVQDNLDEARQWYARSSQLDDSRGEAERELADLEVRQSRAGLAAAAPSAAPLIANSPPETPNLTARAAIIHQQLRVAFEFRRA